MFEKILRVKTTGSRKEENLRPIIQVPVDTNMVVCEYLDDDAECIIQLFSMTDKLKDLEGEEELDKNSYTKRHKHSIGMSMERAEEINRVEKTFKFEGKKVSFKRLEHDQRLGKIIILDESDE